MPFRINDGEVIIENIKELRQSGLNNRQVYQIVKPVFFLIVNID